MTGKLLKQNKYYYKTISNCVFNNRKSDAPVNGFVYYLTYNYWYTVFSHGKNNNIITRDNSSNVSKVTTEKNCNPYCFL